MVKAPSFEIDLRCGGAPVIGPDEERPASDGPAAQHSSGTLIGKRYTDGAELEVLCSKAGSGSLSVGDTKLEIKGAKPLPSSD